MLYYKVIVFLYCMTEASSLGEIPQKALPPKSTADTNRIPDLNQDPNFSFLTKLQEICGANCWSEKTMSVIIATTIYTHNKYISISQLPEADQRKGLGSFCKVKETNQDCFGRYEQTQKLLLLKMRRALIVENERLAMLKCQQGKGSVNYCETMDSRSKGVLQRSPYQDAKERNKILPIQSLNLESLKSITDLADQKNKDFLSAFKPIADDFVKTRKIQASGGEAPLYVSSTEVDQKGYQKALEVWKQASSHYKNISNTPSNAITPEEKKLQKDAYNQVYQQSEQIFNKSSKGELQDNIKSTTSQGIYTEVWSTNAQDAAAERIKIIKDKSASPLQDALNYW